VKNLVVSNIKLGEGDFGPVYFGHFKSDPEKLIAIKRVDRKELRKEHDVKAL